MSAFERDPTADDPRHAASASLPYARQDLEGDNALLVHVKICSENSSEILAAQKIVLQQMAGVRVNDRPVAVFVSGEDVNMTQTDIRNIAALVTPFVLDALGMKKL